MLVGSILPVFALTLVDKLAIAVIFVSLFFYSRTNKYSYSIFFITIQAMMNFAIMGFDVAGFFVPRIIDTILGALISGVAVYCLWPDWKYISLEKTSTEAIQSNAGYLTAVLDELQHGIREDIAYRAARRTSHDKAAALSSVLSDMSSEADKHRDKLDDGFMLLKINYSLISYISALGAYRDKIQTDSEATQQFLAAFYPAANQIAQILQNIAESSESQFQAALNTLDNQLAQLQAAAECDSHATQAQVLTRQLNMMRELLPECYTALHRQLDRAQMHTPQPPVSIQAA